MTYLSEESGASDPIELYEFSIGTTIYRYTDGDADYSHPISGETFVADMVSRSAMHQTEEDNSMSVKVALDVFHPIADFFRTPYLPLRQIWLTIYRTHNGSADIATIFRGRAGQCDFEGTTATVTCIPTRAAIQKRVPVQLVQVLCSNTLYDGRCKADPEAFKGTATITAIDGLTLSVAWALRDTAARPAGWYDGGFLIKPDAPGATILNDLFGPPDTLKVLYNPSYHVGDVITVYAGCDKRLDTCRTKFNNIPHHQGFPNFPQQDPFQNEVL